MQQQTLRSGRFYIANATVGTHKLKVSLDDGKTFIGGDHPSIADIRFAATLEFLRAIDYDFPAWAEEYMTAIETTLGEAYSEPAADVRGYIDYVRSQSG